MIRITKITILLSILINTIVLGQYPVEDFEVFQTDDGEGNLVFILADKAYKNYKDKESAPFALSIYVEIIQQNKNGHPTDQEAEVQNNIENLIFESLRKQCIAHYIGRSTFKGYRELWFFIDKPDKAKSILEDIIEKPKYGNKILYQIEEDPNWTSALILDEI